MEDGGIELNFATPTAGGIRRTVVAQKGGRWTDRVKAKKAARHLIKKLDTHVPVTVPAPVQPTKAGHNTFRATSTFARPAVAAPARKEGGDVRSSTTDQIQISPSRPLPSPRLVSSVARPVQEVSHPVAGPSRLPVAPPQPPTKSSGKAPQIISSLFTADPLPHAPKSTPSVAPGLPSNAPVISDTNTFEGLGLNPLLIHHLRTKMGVEKPTGIQRSALPSMLSSPLDIDVKRDDDDAESIPAEPLRDIFIQSQTGSGKTLAYLLPIIQTLLPLSRLSYIDRSIGTLAIILAPTRELAQQISKVLESLLSMALSLPGEDEEGPGLTRWLVSGLLTGGSTRTHEKARLRKGVPILVSTPGRLLDHLQNTASFNCAKTLYLVLDEADRLMELGFEDTIQGILKALEGRRRIEMRVEKEADEEGGGLMRWSHWGRGRRTVLCSATVDAKVEKLTGMALRDPLIFRGVDGDKPDKVDGKMKSKEVKGKGKEEKSGYLSDPVKTALEEASAISLPETSEDKFTPPTQLSQKYVVTPTKLRLVTLVALLRSLVAIPKGEPIGQGKGMKVIVFFSSTDSVDFHWKLLGGVSMGNAPVNPVAEIVVPDDGEGKESADEGDETSQKVPPVKSKKTKPTVEEQISLFSALFPQTTIHRLHGSLPLRTRQASLKAFAAPSSTPSILLATSVASRGLDLPLVRAVVQYDLPTEGGANEYVHRVGRTARAGKGGEAWAMVGTNESEWVGWVEGKMGSGVRMVQVGVEEVLRKGFGGRSHEFEGRATEVQLAFEKWVLSGNENAILARSAFSSFVKSYSTHPLEEKRFFHIKQIHLGHLAKSFALREAPGSLAASSSTGIKSNGAGSKATVLGENRYKRKRGDGDDEDDGEDDDGEDEEDGGKGGKERTARHETERRMYEAVRKAGRLVRSGGKMGEFSGGKGRGGGGVGSMGGGGGEFQVVGSAELERMVSGKK